MKSIQVPALDTELDRVNDFITAELESYDCSAKVQMQVALAVEEIFVNIAHYAYAPGTGEASIGVDIAGTPPMLTIQFQDNGTPFDPLAKKDADTTLSAEERGIGGLGILLVKKNMDNVRYTYENGQNVLTLQKQL